MTKEVLTWLLEGVIVLAVLWLAACFFTNGRPYLPRQRQP